MQDRVTITLYGSYGFSDWQDIDVPAPLVPAVNQLTTGFDLDNHLASASAWHNAAAAKSNLDGMRRTAESMGLLVERLIDAEIPGTLVDKRAARAVSGTQIADNRPGGVGRYDLAAWGTQWFWMNHTRIPCGHPDAPATFEQNRSRLPFLYAKIRPPLVNKYPGRCGSCSWTVEPGHGWAEFSRTAQAWSVFH